MKRFLFLTISIFVLINGVFSQIKFSQSDFSFYSDFEKEILTNFFNNDTSENLAYLGVFLTSDSKSNAESYRSANHTVVSVVGEIKNSKEFKKGGQKLVKYLYKVVHDRFFDKYNEGVSFADIFEKREYNCATASAMYALILKELDIPFEVNYSENHVFLVAYPLTKPVVVETTNPLVGTITYSKTFIDEYVAYLRKSKLISQSEFSSKSTEVIFREYFFKTRKGDIGTLAGILYYNRGITLFQAKDYVNSLQMGIRSSYFMNDFENNNFLVTSSALMILQSTNYSSPHYFATLGLLSGLNENYVSKDDILNSVGNFFRNFAIDGNEDLLKKSFQTFTESSSDSSIKFNARFSFLKEMGRLNYLKGEYRKAFQYLDSALILKSDNEAELIMVDILPRILSEMDSPDQAIATIDSLFLKHPKLSENTLAQKVKSQLILFAIIHSFENQDIKNGEKYISTFSKEYPEQNTQVINIDIFEKAIGTAAIYYYRIGQTKKSKEKAELGLRYYPNSSYLRRIMNSLSN